MFYTTYSLSIFLFKSKIFLNIFLSKTTALLSADSCRSRTCIEPLVRLELYIMSLSPFSIVILIWTALSSQSSTCLLRQANFYLSMIISFSIDTCYLMFINFSNLYSKVFRPMIRFMFLSRSIDVFPLSLWLVSRFLFFWLNVTAFAFPYSCETLFFSYKQYFVGKRRQGRFPRVNNGNEMMKIIMKQQGQTQWNGEKTEKRVRKKGENPGLWHDCDLHTRRHLKSLMIAGTCCENSGSVVRSNTCIRKYVLHFVNMSFRQPMCVWSEKNE